jgi:hypothetical protein
MATVTPTITTLTEVGKGHVGYLVVWSGMANGDSGAAYVNVSAADRSVQVTGTFGASGTVKIQGSNDTSNFAQLHDAAGDELSFTAAGIEAIAEVTQHIRPIVTGGDETTSLTTTLLTRWT